MTTAKIYKELTTPKASKEEQSSKDFQQQESLGFEQEIENQAYQNWLNNPYTQKTLAELEIKKCAYIKTASELSVALGDIAKLETTIRINLVQAETLNSVIKYVNRIK